MGINYDLVGFSEIDKYAITSYCAIHNVGEDKNLGDVSKIDIEDIPSCDLVTYGFPCQDISIAGHQKGIVKGKTRSGLLYEALRIIEGKKPKYAIAENVKNLVGKKFKDDFDNLLKELDEIGYNSYWQVLNAKNYGIPQNRERVFIISIRKDIDDGNFKFPKPFDNGLRLKDLLEEEVDERYYIDNDRVKQLLSELKEKNLLKGERFGADSTINDPQRRDISNCITARYDAGIQNQKQIGMVVAEPNELQFVGGIGDKDWVGDGKELSRNYPQGNRVYHIEGIAVSQTAQGGGLGGVTGLYLEENTPNELQLFTNLEGGKWDKMQEINRRVYGEEGIAPTLTTMGGGHREPKVAVKEATKKGYAIATVGDSINIAFPNSATRRGRVGEGVAQTLETGCNQATLENDYRIRKLTPKECWRLMGFSDEDFEKARQALIDTHYNGSDRANSQLYKQAGNSIVVDVLVSIYRNLLKDYISN